MTDLEKLKKYLCPRCNHDPWVCLECAGLRNCTAGQRAVVLLDRQTGPDAKPTNPNVVRAREKLRQALSSPDPIQWLLDNGTPSRHAAVEFVRTASIKYPDIAGSMKKAATEEKKEESDLISVADFLKEAGLSSADEPGTVPVAESIVNAPVAKEDTLSLWLDNKLKDFEQAKELLQHERSLLEEKIRAIDEKISRISSNQDAIRTVQEIRSMEKAV